MTVSKQIDSINILFVSNSKLLKNRFIESISNDLNTFSLMTKSLDRLELTNERISFSCLVSDYTIENEDSKYLTNYVQLIEAAEKNLLNNLVYKSANPSFDQNFKFNIHSIIYLYDETSSDTFAFIQSIHNEIKKNFSDFLQNEDLTILLCNMINASKINSRSSEEDSFRLIGLVENFLDEFKNIQYVAQPYEHSVYGYVPVVNESEGKENKLKKNFDSLISRILPSLIKSIKKGELTDSTMMDIKSTTNSLNSDSLNKKSSTTFKKEMPKVNYKGEMENNLRNGFGVYIYDNRFFKYEGEWKNGIKHGKLNSPFYLKNLRIFPI